MGFRNSILAGLTLIREAIRSPNYVAGTSGWSINADGSAEFSDVTLRGDGVGYTIIVGPDGKPQVLIGSNASQGFIQFPSNSALESSPLTLLAHVGNQGLPGEYVTFQIQGAEMSGALGAHLSWQVDSASYDGTFQPAVGCVRNGTDVIFNILDNGVQVKKVWLGVRPDPSALVPLFVDADAAHTGGLFALLKGGNTMMQVTAGGRLALTPEASANSALIVDAPTGYTGMLGRWRVNGADMAYINPAGSFWSRNLTSGTVQTPAPGGVPAQTSASIVFGTPFPAGTTPRVVLTPNSTAANLNTSNIRHAVTAVSNTGFTVNCWRDTNNATNFDWVAYATP